jgi:hypothetical protein
MPEKIALNTDQFIGSGSPPGVPHNITNVSEKPARVLMTVSPPGHEHYFEELAKLAAQGAPDPKALADLRNRNDTTQLSTLTTRA